MRDLLTSRPPQHWRTVPLKHLGSIGSGGTPSSTAPSYWNGEINWATPSDVTNLAGRYISRTERTISREGLNNSSAQLISTRSLIVCTRATIGYCAITLIPLATNQGFKSITPYADKVDVDFLFHVIRASRPTMERLANSSTFAELSKTQFEQLEVPLPPLAEQRRIAAILSTWDDALERLSAQIDKKSNVFASLRASLITGKRRLIGRNDTWASRPLRDFLDPIKRAVPKPTDRYLALSIRSHGKGTFQRLVDRPDTVDMDTLYCVGGRDLIVNITFAWEGAVALAKPEDDGCLVSHRFPTFFIDESAVARDFIGYVIREKRFCHFLSMVSPGGAGRNRVLNQKDFLDIEVSLPSLAEQRAIAELLVDSEREIAVLTAERTALTKQRDALATELLTGRLRVREAEVAL